MKIDRKNFNLPDGSKQKYLFCLLLLIVCSAYSIIAAAAEAPNSGRNNNPPVDARSRRTPPKVAIDACTGKTEGDSCTFNSGDSTMNGECLAGIENIFACRPHRGVPPVNTQSVASPKPPKEPQTAPAEQQSETGSALRQESSPEPKAETETTKNKKQTRPDEPITTTKVQETNPGISPVPTSQLPSPLPSGGLVEKIKSNVGAFGIYLIVALLSAGLTWFTFYRYYIVPLRRLRRVTQQLAGGDLSARVGEGLEERKNEVADLGRDVDRMAERIESLVGAHQRLIRDVSHELRSPLARLNVALELARQSAGSMHSAPFDRIERESERLNELIGQLLMLTKLESESGTIARVDFDIAGLISEIGQDVDFEAKSDNRRVVVTASEPLMLNGNKELLRQAVENLVRNAARYTADGTSVEISLKKKESGGRHWVHIEVKDQGPGVPESELYDIFRPFYRVSDSRERQSGGTGVGLAISDRAVRLHGGSLRAFNAPGSGLIMEVELPLG